ncbi:MAG: right-handed parallel beta-helix repeat-containing protein, partial [Pseudonocardia sp.]|nr:right-handed parallel beta-helix repeat-containing protein [Pseudonocardia sp.]
VAPTPEPMDRSWSAMNRRTAAALLLAALTVTSCGRLVAGDAQPTPSPGIGPAVPVASAAPGADTTCDGTAVTDVATADDLSAALTAARPGAVIRLAAGTYAGHFTAKTPGTADAPITLCGPRDAVLEGGSTEESGYTLHLDGADHWRVAGFSVHGGQKGVMVDRSNFVTIEGLQVTEVGDEAIHLRQSSSDNVVRGNVIRSTGLRKEKFGEGIYIGSAESNWDKYGTNGGPDRSDRNVIEGNDIAQTTAESVDIKEGTTAGVLRGNTFSGAGMSDANTWVNVKGNEWQILDNTGTDAPEDGFQTQRILDGWGARNTFAGNTAVVNGPGYGIKITKDEDGNTVACSNTAQAAAKGLTNIDCTR